MGHGRSPHAGSRIGRTSRQETIGVAVGDTELALEPAGSLGSQGIGTSQVETGLHRLDPDMVFFIDHDRQGLIPADDDPVMLARLGQVFTHQMLFHQSQEVDLAERLEVNV